MEDATPKRKCGYRMDPELRKKISRMGGRAAHEKGRAHEFTSDEARAAGAKGGAAVSADRTHMSRIGKLGAKARAESIMAKKGAASNARAKMPETPTEGKQKEFEQVKNSWTEGSLVD
jgi:general stress protein YciG